MVELNANGSYVNSAMVVYVLSLLGAECRPTQAVMAESQRKAWERGGLPYLVHLKTMSSLAGIPIKVADVPKDEIQFLSGDELVAKISHLEYAGCDG